MEQGIAFVPYKPHIADRQIRQTMTLRANESYFSSNVKIIEHSEEWELTHAFCMALDMLDEEVDVEAQRAIEGF